MQMIVQLQVIIGCVVLCFCGVHRGGRKLQARLAAGLVF
jgi:hypothetical protein